MDWLLPLYSEYIDREFHRPGGACPGNSLEEAFMGTLASSTATLFIMEPTSGSNIRFKGLGRWMLPEQPEFLADPNAFIADRFGGGKYKVNFHHGATFVCTHNFRTWGDERWRTMDEVFFE